MKNNLIVPTAEPFLFTGGKTGCVLIHGFTGTPKEMRLMGEALHKRGITCLGIRLAGHATCPQDLLRTRWTDWLASVEDGIDLLRDSCESIFLAGLSLGGILALTTAAKVDVSGVIAMSTPYAISTDWRLKYARPLSLIVPYIKKEPDKTDDIKPAKGHIDYPAYPSRSIAELNDACLFMRSCLLDIKVPVLLINSRSDPTVPFEQAEKIKNLLTARDIQQVILENSGHVITEGNEREAVFASAYKFITQYSKK